MSRHINIPENSWHFWLYAWWREYSEYTKPQEFRENACHYIRVVFFWAPLGFFLHKPVIGKFRPWMLFAILMAFVATIYALIKDPDSAVIFWVVYSTVCFTIFTFYFVFFKERNRYVENLLKAIASFLTPAGVVTRKGWRKFVIPWYFEQHKYVQHTRFATAVAMLVLIYLLFGGKLVLTIIGALFTVLVLFIFAVLASILIVATIVGVSLAFKKAVGNKVKRSGISTVGLLKVYRDTKWGSLICPFINLPHQWVEEHTYIDEEEYVDFGIDGLNEEE